MEPMSASAVSQLVTFWVGDRYCGIPVESVQELLRRLPITPVPLAGDAICGLINLRGQIVTAIDMRQRLGLPAGVAEAAPAMSIILRTEQGPLSVMVDRVGEVLDVDPAAVDPPPESLNGEARRVVRGVVKLPDRLLLVLDSGEVTRNRVVSA
jgi:purine-binding chemotaxis protein CheW